MIDKVQQVVLDGIQAQAYPGACYSFGNLSRTWTGAAGRQMYCDESDSIRIDEMWDLASVSKVIATTTIAMIAFEDGLLDLDEPVAKTIAAFGTRGKQTIAARNLLLHNSGLIAFRRYYLEYDSPGAILEAIFDEPLQHPVGQETVYSDLNMIVMLKLLEAKFDQGWTSLLDQHVTGPCGLTNTLYNPPPKSHRRCAPTEFVEPWREALHKKWGLKDSTVEVAGPPAPDHPEIHEYIRGEVHDPNAMALGGVAGHAGLFSTAKDLATFCRAHLKGAAPHGRWPRPETIKLFTTRSDASSTRALGWDTKNLDGYTSAGSHFSDSSFGHTGYTGTSVWIDPVKNRFAILLTNRVHPTSNNEKLTPIRPLFADAASIEMDGKNP